MAMPVLSAACPADADAIRALMARAIARGVTQDDALLADTLANANTNVDRWLAQPQQCVHLKAAAGGQIVGVVLVKDFWNLCSLFVAPEWQGRGVGRALLEAGQPGLRGPQPQVGSFPERGAQCRGLLRTPGVHRARFEAATAAGVPGHAAPVARARHILSGSEAVTRTRDRFPQTRYWFAGRPFLY